MFSEGGKCHSYFIDEEAISKKEVKGMLNDRPKTEPSDSKYVLSLYES